MLSTEHKANILRKAGYAVPALLCQPMLPDSEAFHAGAERCNFMMTPDDGKPYGSCASCHASRAAMTPNSAARE